jgi:RNA polymerase sigma-70 factor, ECF subfamily
MVASDERRALNDLYSRVYEELRRLARGVLRGEYGPVECSATTLVNEVWLKLASAPQTGECTPLHFRRIAARAMRQILVDAARRRRAVIHGGGLVRVTLDPAVMGVNGSDDREMLALDAALEELKLLSPRQAQLVEARFFGGLSCLECAELLAVSEATVMREWRVARAWLARAIRPLTCDSDCPVTEQRV